MMHQISALNQLKFLSFPWKRSSSYGVWGGARKLKDEWLHGDNYVMRIKESWKVQVQMNLMTWSFLCFLLAPEFRFLMQSWKIRVSCMNRANKATAFLSRGNKRVLELTGKSGTGNMSANSSCCWFRGGDFEKNSERRCITNWNKRVKCKQWCQLINAIGCNNWSRVWCAFKNIEPFSANSTY